MRRAKRMRISQHMSQHIMQLKLALCMASSVKQITYRMDMFIPRALWFVNSFFREMPRADFSLPARGSYRSGQKELTVRGKSCIT